MNVPATLDHAAIAGLIPHAGSMCLLARVEAWDERRIRCVATSHADRGNPLRSASGLLASARGVRLHRLRLDDLAGELAIETEHLAGDDRQLLYAFTVQHAGQPVADGRLAVVLDTPLPA